MASKFTITAELNLQTKNLGQTVNNLKQQFRGMDVNIKVKDLAAAESSIRNISKEAKSASQSMGLLGSSIGMAFKRFAAVTLATGTIVGFTRAIKNTVGDAISFEREIVKIAQATGKTVAQLKTLGNEVGNVATNFGVSSKELLSAARSLTQAGFAADKVTGALKILAQTELAATFDSIGDTTEGVIALLNQFGRTAQSTGSEIDFLEKSLSAINQVSKEFAVESSDLITVIRTTGSAFESAGGSLDELLALFTSVRATTRESAESIATGFRTIFTRVQRVDTINALRDLGIELQDTEGKFVGPMEAAKRLSVALSTIDPKDFRFNMVVEELGGFRQVSKVIPLIQQFAVTQKALNVAQGSSGSLAKDAQTAQQSLAVQIQKTREEFLRFVRDLTESSSFQNTAKFLLEVANAFIRVADTMKPLIPLIASFGALKIGQAFLPSIKGFLGTKKAQGGKIHAFASGGMVPGSGNGDTVPAMLTPGEFVIRKSSVKKLGAENLARANKYAGGGPINNLPGKSIQAEIKNGSGEKIGITNDTFATKSFGKRQIAIYDEADQVNNDNITFFYARQKTNNGQGLTGPKVQVSDKDAKKLFTNNKTSANEFEKIVAKVTGGALQTTKDSNYPVDIIKGNRLIDVKYTPPESYGENDGLSKALNYELSMGMRGYNYAGKNNITLNDSEPKFLNKPMTIGKDNFKSEKDFSFYFPSFDLSENGVAQLKVKDIAEKQIEKNLENIKRKLNKAGNSEETNTYLQSLIARNKTAQTNLPSGDFAIRGDKSQINTLSPYSPFKRPKKKANGGMIQYLALGGPAGKSRAARAITIPRIDSYTFDKPAGVDLDSVNSKKQQYKLNAEDRLDYDVNNVNVDVSKLKVSESLLEQYNTADDQKRGYRFEDILKETGMAKSLSQVSNARLDGITAAGDPFEAKSRKSAIGISELEDKLYGAISDNISDPEKLARARFNANDLTEKEDHIKIGKVTVFEDITRGLGAAVNTKARMGYAEEEAAKQAKEQNKMASVNAQQKLQDLVKNNFGSGFIIQGKQYSPVTKADTVHPDVPMNLNQLLGGKYQDTIGLNGGPAKVLKLLKKFIVRNPVQNKASGGSIADLAWLASGGAASGTDTVPAMLTPGEYVINKKSAQAIGYGSLNRMNKVGKFANGGPVKHFAVGGQATFDQGQQQMQKALFIPKIQALVSPGQLKTIEKIVDDYIKDNKDAEAVMKAIVRDLENQKKQTGQVKIGKPLIERAERAATRNGMLVAPPAPPKDPEMPKLSERLKTLSDSTDNTATKFLIMAGVAQSVVSQMSGLSDEVKNATSAFGATFATYMAIGNGLKDLTINISQSIAKRVEENAAKKAEQIAREAQNAAIKRNAAAFDAHSAKLNSKGGGGLDAGGGKLAKGAAIFDGALMGFSVAMGIAAAATEYYATLARKAGKELDETVAKFKKDSTSVNQGELSNKFTKALTTSARADSISRNTQSTGGVATVGVSALGGAAAGAAIGSIFPVIGTAVGAAIGGIVGALGGLAALFLKANVEFNRAFENIQKSANNLSSSIYESVTATVKARKFLEKIDTKSTKDIFSELNSTTNTYVSSLDKAVAGEAAAIAAFGSIEKVPEQFKKSIDEVKQSAMELKQELDKIAAANIGKKVKELAAKIGTTNFDVVKDITAFVDSQQQNISKSSFSETKANYSGRFAELQAKGADTSGLDIKVMSLSVVKAAHAAEELKLSLLEASLQVVAQKEAILKEKAIRDKLIGTLIEQQAFDTAFSNFKFSLDKITSEVDNIAAVYSGSVAGLKSAIPDSSILDVKNPMGDNAKDFNDALGVISSIGPAGQKLSSTISDLNKTMPKFEVALNSVNSVDFSKFFDPKTGKDAVEKFIGGLGIDTKGAVAEAMRDSFAQAADTANMKQGEELGREDRTKKIFDTFNEIAKINSERGKQVLEVFKASEAKAQAIQEAINQSRERQLELELSNADAYEALQKNIAQARGRSMSLAEGDQLRGNRQTILAGNLGGNAKAIGAELANVRKQLADNLGNKGDLQNKSKKLTKALEELANQSGRTSEIMSKIEEAKAKRETARDFAKDFVFGTNEQRDTMQKDISNARTAAQQGNLSSVAEEDRAGVGAMFERFKDLPIFNGMTGRQAQNKVLANEVRASGGGEDMARMIEQDMSSPEEKLIQELKNTADSEMAARQELFNKEEENIKENMTALNNNTAALKSFVGNLAAAKANAETAKAEVEKNQDKAPDVKALEEQRKNLTAEIETTNTNITKLAGKIVELTTTIDKAISQMYLDIEKRKAQAGEANEALPNSSGPGIVRAKGGLVYLASGGDVFKPQGTDTVPAMLTPGEFVIKKSSVDKIGSDKLNQLNQGGDIKTFAKGGLVAYLERGGFPPSGGDVIDKLSKRVTKLEKETKELKQENESLKTKIEETEQVGGVRNQMQNIQNMTGNIATNQQQQQQSLPEYGNRPMRGTRSQIRARQAAMRRQSDDVFKEEGFDQNTSNTTTTIDRRGTKDQVRARERALKRRDGKDIAEEMGMGPETAVKPVNTETQAPVSEYDKLHKELINPRTTASRSREIMARQSELEKLTAQEQDKQTQAMNDRVSASKAETSATAQHTLDASKYGDVPESPFTTAALNDIEKRYAEKSANVDKEISDVNAQGLAIGQKKMAEAMQFNERQVPQEKLYEQEEMMAQLESVGVSSNPAEYTYGEVVDKRMADLKAKYDAESAKALDANNMEIAGQLGKQYTKDRMALESQSEEGYSKVKGTGEGVDAEGNTIDTTYGVFDGHRMPAHEASALMNKRVTSALIKKNQTPVDENGNPLEGNTVSRFLDRGLKAIVESYLKPTIGRAMDAIPGLMPTQEDVNKKVDDEAKKPMTKAELADVRHGIRMDQLSRGQLGLAAASNTTAEQTLRETNALTPSSYKGAEGYGGYYENPPLSKTQTVSTPEEVDAQLKVHQDRYKAMGLHLGGVISYLARGGRSRGSDTVPAMLTPGEFVMNKDSVSKYGTSFMEKLNKGGVVPGFANGGAVGQRNDAQTTAVQQSPVKTVVDSATPREQPAPKMMDDGLFARSVESLNTIASTFSSFTETLQGLVSQFAGITVKHTMTVDGNLAITGVDPATIGKTIADALMKSIGDETLKQIQMKQDQKQGPMR